MDATKIEAIVSNINNAKTEIESMSGSINCECSKEELGLAYNSLNDSINHCNTILKQSKVNSVMSNINNAKA